MPMNAVATGARAREPVARRLVLMPWLTGMGGLLSGCGDGGAAPADRDGKQDVIVGGGQVAALAGDVDDDGAAAIVGRNADPGQFQPRFPSRQGDGGSGEEQLARDAVRGLVRSEEHTSELQSQMR